MGSRMDVAEPTLTCPYNKAHSIISSRMQFHLAKCRIQHPTNEKATCPFNSTHVIPNVEYEYHLSFCEDRIVLDAFTCIVGSSRATRNDLTRVEPIEVKSDENWEVDDEPPVSVLERVHETSKTKPTLQALIGAPKSERKAFRNQERLRIQRVLDSQEYKNGEVPSTSKSEAAEGSRRKTEQREEGTSKGCKDMTARENEIIAKRNFNTSYNRTTNAEESQATETEIPRTAIPAPPRDPQNAWGLPKQNGIRSANIPKLNAWNNCGDGAASTSSSASTPMSSFGDGVVRSKNSFINAKPHSPPAQVRDPGNPWRVARPPSSNDNSPTDPGDFPMLPVAGRGRGRFRTKK